MKILFTGNLNYDKFLKVYEESDNFKNYEIRSNQVKNIFFEKYNGSTSKIDCRNFANVVEIISYDENSVLSFNGLEAKLPKGKFAFEYQSLVYTGIILSGNCKVSYYHPLDSNEKSGLRTRLAIDKYYLIVGDTFVQIYDGHANFNFSQWNGHIRCHVKSPKYDSFIEIPKEEMEYGMYKLMTDEEYDDINFFIRNGCKKSKILISSED